MHRSGSGRLLLRVHDHQHTRWSYCQSTCQAHRIVWGPGGSGHFALHSSHGQAQHHATHRQPGADGSGHGKLQRLARACFLSLAFEIRKLLEQAFLIDSEKRRAERIFSLYYQHSSSSSPPLPPSPPPLLSLTDVIQCLWFLGFAV